MVPKGPAAEAFDEEQGSERNSAEPLFHRTTNTKLFQSKHSRVTVVRARERTRNVILGTAKLLSKLPPQFFLGFVSVHITP